LAKKGPKSLKYGWNLHSKKRDFRRKPPIKRDFLPHKTACNLQGQNRKKSKKRPRTAPFWGVKKAKTHKFGCFWFFGVKNRIPRKSGPAPVYFAPLFREKTHKTRLKKYRKITVIPPWFLRICVFFGAKKGCSMQTHFLFLTHKNREKNPKKKVFWGPKRAIFGQNRLYLGQNVTFSDLFGQFSTLFSKLFPKKARIPCFINAFFSISF
jgi:hypothetical protein